MLFTQWGIAPFTDNAVGDSYHYHVTVHTGMRSGSGTTSNVFLMLGGENCDSEVRKVEDTLDRVHHRILHTVKYNINSLHVITLLLSAIVKRKCQQLLAKRSRRTWTADVPENLA